MKIGMIGFGTVGRGVYTILKEEKDKIESYLGERVDLVKINNRHPQKLIDFGLDADLICPQPMDMIQDPDLDLIVEVSSSKTDSVTYILEALRSGKAVVTANKAAVAAAYAPIWEEAKKQGKAFRCEACVAGALPILRTIEDRLPFNRILSFQGIINGSSNYVLSEMAKKRKSEDILKDARKLGVLEADPSDDLKGYDARRKLVIAANLLMETGSIQEKEIPCIGVDQLPAEAVADLADQGLIVKLNAFYTASSAQSPEEAFDSKRPSVEPVSAEQGNYRAFVLPQALASAHPLAHVDGISTCTQILGSRTSDLFISGEGGGMYPTADAIVSDILSILRESRPYYPVFKQEKTENQAWVDEHDFYCYQAGQVSQRKLTVKEAQSLYEQGAGLILLK